MDLSLKTFFLISTGCLLAFSNQGFAAQLLDKTIAKILMLRCKEPLKWQQTGAALKIAQPQTVPNNFAIVFKVSLR